MLKAYNDNNNKFRWEKLRWANQNDWLTRLIYTQMDGQRQTDTCTSINLHCCTQTPENIIIKTDYLYISLLRRSFFITSQPEFVLHQSCYDVLYRLPIKKIIYLFNYLIISKLIHQTLVVKPQNSLFSRTDTYTYWVHLEGKK